MDCLPDHESMCFWLLHYGPWAIFVLLALGIVALPVPEETLLVITGTLMYKQVLPVHHSILAAICGSLTGITVSYLLGRTAGAWILNRYGEWFGIGENKQTKAHYWFEKYGKGALFVGYFIPGVRHFTGLIAGMTKLDYASFALWAYSGAVVWIATFLSLGYFFGEWGLSFFDNIELTEQKIIIAIVSIVVAIGAYLFYRTRRQNK